MTLANKAAEAWRPSDVGCQDRCGATEDAHCWNESEWENEPTPTGVLAYTPDTQEDEEDDYVEDQFIIDDCAAYELVRESETEYEYEDEDDNYDADREEAEKDEEHEA